SYPVNLFSLDLRARKHLMLAGGIGITPFMAQTAQLAAEGGNFELHYTCRTASLGTYADVLRERYDRRVRLYHDDRDERIELDRLLSSQPLGTHLYVCGPSGMIGWVRD
ncbi:MAG: oxidoreductase, partial [Mesorhizobium sp.]